MKGYADVLRVYRWSFLLPFKQLHYGFRGVKFEDQPLSDDEPLFYPREQLSSITTEDIISAPAIVYAGLSGTLAHGVGNIIGIPSRLVEKEKTDNFKKF